MTMLNLLAQGRWSDFFIIIITLVLSIALHEFGHAAVDDLEGDPTARLAGRLTLNPVRHLDPFGTLMIALVGFGWGKPVPITPSRLRNRRFGAALVGFAGPMVNVLLAFVAGVLFVRLSLDGQFTLTGRFLYAMLSLNVLLAVLNVLPIPPLDGSRILSAVLPPERQQIIYFLDQWGFVILLISALFVLPRLLPPIAAHGTSLILHIVG